MQGSIADTLFVGATRPPMRWGVTYAALLFNLVFTWSVPAHEEPPDCCWSRCRSTVSAMLLCARDARFFDLIALWGRTRCRRSCANLRFWSASSYSPLQLDLPDSRQKAPAAADRRGAPRVHRGTETAHVEACCAAASRAQRWRSTSRIPRMSSTNVVKTGAGRLRAGVSACGRELRERG